MFECVIEINVATQSRAIKGRRTFETSLLFQTDFSFNAIGYFLFEVNVSPQCQYFVNTLGIYSQIQEANLLFSCTYSYKPFIPNVFVAPIGISAEAIYNLFLWHIDNVQLQFTVDTKTVLVQPQKRNKWQKKLKIAKGKWNYDGIWIFRNE